MQTIVHVRRRVNIWYWIGLLLLLGWGILLLHSLLVRSWDKVPCQIVQNIPDETQARSGIPVLHPARLIRFTYTVNGKQYTSNRFSNKNSSPAEYDSRYLPGVHATCYVNPADPGKAFLTAPLFPGWQELAVLTVAFAAGFLMSHPVSARKAAQN